VLIQGSPGAKTIVPQSMKIRRAIGFALIKTNFTAFLLEKLQFAAHLAIFSSP